MWKFKGNDMFMDLDEPIRFKVAQLDFPPLPVEQEKGAPPFAPMRIVVGSCDTALESRKGMLSASLFFLLSISG